MKISKVTDYAALNISLYAGIMQSIKIELTDSAQYLAI